MGLHVAQSAVAEGRGRPARLGRAAAPLWARAARSVAARPGLRPARRSAWRREAGEGAVGGGQRSAAVGSAGLIVGVGEAPFFRTFATSIRVT